MGRSDRHKKKYDERRRDAFRFGKTKTRTFEPSIHLHLFEKHSRFPDAKLVITVVSQLSLSERAREHAIVIAKRTVACDTHEKHSAPGALVYVDSQGLGGKNGLHEAHIYRVNYPESEISGTHYHCSQEGEAVNKLRLMLAERHITFEHPEITGLVKKLRLNLH